MMRAKGAMAPAQRFLLILFLLVALHTRVAWAAPCQAPGSDESGGNGHPAYPLDLGLHPLGFPAGLPREKYPAEGGRKSPEPSEVVRDILKELDALPVAVQEVVFPEGHSNSLPVPGEATEAMTDAVRQEIPAVPKTQSMAKIINAQDAQMSWIIGTAVALAFLLLTAVCCLVSLMPWIKKMRDASAVLEAQLEAGGRSGTNEGWNPPQQPPLPPASPEARPDSQEPLLPTSLFPASLDQEQNLSSPGQLQTPPEEPPCHTTPQCQKPFPVAESQLGAGAAPQTHPMGQFPLEARDPAALAKRMHSEGSSRTPRTPRREQPDHQPRRLASGSGRQPEVTPGLFADCWRFLMRRQRRSRRQPRSKASPTTVRRESGKKRKTGGSGQRRSTRPTKGKE